MSGGELRGRVLSVPAETRPTEGRVRESLFSIWGERVRGCRFLDLFAGSGVVGLEALSRGARWVVFVEAEPRALRTLAVNLRRVAADRVAVRPAGCRRSWRGCGPAGSRSISSSPIRPTATPPTPHCWRPWRPCWVRPAKWRWSTRAGKVGTEAGGLVRVDDRRYGGSALTFYRRVRRNSEKLKQSPRWAAGIRSR